MPPKPSKGPAADRGDYPPITSPAWRARFRARLLKWYGAERRALPWRETRDPYAIWVSEIMLQQTQVATVIPYYQRFLAAFPTVIALADAEESRVLRLWEGLGYYRRARQMHAAAIRIRDEYGGSFPTDFETVRSLPGVGRYTAGAVLSLALDQRHPILEANTRRLFARLLAFRGDPRTTAGEALLWQAAEAWLPRNHVGAFNQALMELGSLICKPREPACDRCPAQGLCQAAQLGLVDSIPMPAKRPVIEAVREAAIIVTQEQQVLLLQRRADERWAGLWDFPRIPLTTANPAAIGDALAAAVARDTGVSIHSPAHVATLKHGVTRFRITLDCYTAATRDIATARHIAAAASDRIWSWVAADQLEHFPLSVTGRKMCRFVPCR